MGKGASMRHRWLAGSLVVVGVWMSGSTAQAAVVIDWVPIGHPGNVNDTEPGAYGTVNYAYGMGTYEVTAGQYTAFLNAVAATDTYGLYNTDMGDPAIALGCNIQRTGLPGSLSYAVANDWADRPVNAVSWGDTARFANWMHNGQPTGSQGPGTTETGSYALSGAMEEAPLMAVVRASDATWVIPTVNEWYKAAFYDGDAGIYYDLPMGTDLDWPNLPGNDVLDPDPGNSANYESPWTGGSTLGAPYWRTEVGEFENSASPYGTFDQGGNVWEWNESVFDATTRSIRGGSFGFSHGLVLHAMTPSHLSPTDEVNLTGFRLALVPEPATLTLLALAAGGMLMRTRRRSRYARRA